MKIIKSLLCVILMLCMNISAYASNCSHNSTIKDASNYSPEYEQIAGDVVNHNVSEYYDKICEECGEIVEEKVAEEPWTAEHNFIDGVCEECGYGGSSDDYDDGDYTDDGDSYTAPTPDYQNDYNIQKSESVYEFEVNNVTNPHSPKKGKTNVNREPRTGDLFEFTIVTAPDVYNLSLCVDVPDVTEWNEYSYEYLLDHCGLRYYTYYDGKKEWSCQLSFNDAGERTFKLKIDGQETGYTANATLYEDNNVLEAGEITVKVDGKNIDFDVPPQIINGRTMVPVRAIFESIGATVEWDEETRTVLAEKRTEWNNLFVKFTIDSNVMHCSFAPSTRTIDSPAVIINNRTLVPARAAAEGFGYAVEWDEKTRTVYIYK